MRNYEIMDILQEIKSKGKIELSYFVIVNMFPAQKYIGISNDTWSTMEQFALWCQQNGLEYAQKPNHNIYLVKPIQIKLIESKHKGHYKSFGLKVFGFLMFIHFSSRAVFCKKLGIWDFSIHFKYRKNEKVNEMDKPS